MKSKYSFLALAIAFGLTACGDNVENIYQTGMEVYSSEDDLPKCTDDNEGEQAYLKDADAMRICVDGKWKSMDAAAAEFSCKMVELKDKSGSKIVCNGDSIGVVLNGEKGEDGKQGEKGDDGEDGVSGTGCSITDRNDTAVVVQCGDSTMTISLGQSAEPDEGDLDREPISLDSLAGYTQKGPFLKGSTVYLYELSDGRTLKQTNGNFTSNISSDDGRYKFSARDLVSQYAMVVVDGYYRNEVTGATSDATIRLKALTDMRKRSSVNVNLLTHMEFDRVYNLVTREKLTVKKAKQQAQEEILNLFHIKLDNKTDAEDMDVFGKSDADAALLAISVILQGDRSEAELASLLAALAADLADNGLWDNLRDRAQIADWAMKKTFSAEGLAAIRANVEGWGLGDGKAPAFEGMVTHFWETELKVGACTAENSGAIKSIGNKYSVYFAQKDSTASEGDSSDVRLICAADGDSYAWRYATDIEKNTASFTEVSEGLVKYGAVNTKNVYVYEDGWRRGSDLDMTLNLSCIANRAGKIVKSVTTWYTCDSESTAWREATAIEADTAGFGKPTGDDPIVRIGNVDKSKTYVYENGWRYGTNLDNDARLGPCLKDSVGVIRQIGTGDQGYYRCSDDVPGTVDGNVIPYVWRQASSDEADTAGFAKKPNLQNGMIYKGKLKAPKDNYYKYTAGSWERATEYEMDTHDTTTHLPWVSEDDGTFRAGIVNANLYYVYDAYMGKWRLETSEFDHDPELNGCTVRRSAERYEPEKGTTIKGTIVKKISNDTYYYCRDTVWVVASQARWDTFGEYCRRDNRVTHGIINPDSVYVCEADTFRTLTDDERWVKNYSAYNPDYYKFNEFIRCTEADQYESLILGGPWTMYYCVDRHYVWDGEISFVGLGYVKDESDSINIYTHDNESNTWTREKIARDGSDSININIYGIGTQIWAQENMPPINGKGFYMDYANRAAGGYFTFEEAQSICENLHIDTTGLYFNSGYHTFRLPSKKDWEILLANIGLNEGETFYDLKANTIGQYLVKEGGQKNDHYKFSAIPGGAVRSSSEGKEEILSNGEMYWWTSEGGHIMAYRGEATVGYYPYGTSDTLSRVGVRCIANGSVDLPPPYNKDPIETIVFPRE